jgi:hypothetical protein
MGDITDIRAGIAANLATLKDDAHIDPYQQSRPNLPGIYVVGPSIAYDMSFGDQDATYTVIVRALVQASSDVGGQKLLDRWKSQGGNDSLKTLIESDKQLGGACADLRVESVSQDQVYVFENVEALGAEWSVTVIT